MTIATHDSQILPKFIKVNKVNIYSYASYYRSETIVTDVIPMYIDIESIFCINPNKCTAVKRNSKEIIEYYSIRLKYNLISGMSPNNELYVDSKSFEMITRYLIN